jgi:hypothetical protein
LDKNQDMKNQSTVVNQQTKIMALFLLAAVLVTATAFAQEGNTIKRGLTTGRLESILISLLGLTSLIFSIRHFRSSKNSAFLNKRKGIMIAGLLGLICIILAGIHIANSTGGFGTGSGKAGAIVAIALGLIAIILSGISLRRFRRAG